MTQIEAPDRDSSRMSRPAANEPWDESPEPEIASADLTAEQIARLNHGALRLLARLVLVQLVAVVAVVLVAWGWAGAAAAVSALVGAGSYALPNVLFALRLMFSAVGVGKASPVTFFLGEFLKLGATAALLVLGVSLAGGALVWPALIAGLIVALKSHYALSLFKSS
ncbi:MAG: ATP synthase subunit I [Pigmentiphaga sp.]|nr:ATP synthase subunit I [Pigmentiphaga sp.]